MGLATIANWSANLVVTLTFLDLVEAVGAAGTFTLFAIACAGAYVFIDRLLPETRGRSLEQAPSVTASPSHAT
jgi:hypothetical protein